MLKFTQFCNFQELQEKSVFLLIVAQRSETGNFLKIFWRFWDFWDSFSYENPSYKKNMYFVMEECQVIYGKKIFAGLSI